MDQVCGSIPLRCSARDQDANTHRFFGGHFAGDQKSKTNFSDFYPSRLRVRELKRNVVTNSETPGSSPKWRASPDRRYDPAAAARFHSSTESS